MLTQVRQRKLVLSDWPKNEQTKTKNVFTYYYILTSNNCEITIDNGNLERVVYAM